MIRSTTTEADGVALLLERFRKHTDAANLLRSYLAGLQRSEDLAWDAHDHMIDIEASYGIQLDRIGTIVQRGRGSFGDPAYRIALRVQILINRASAVEPEIRTILETAMPGIPWRIREFPPAFGYVEADAALTREEYEAIVYALKQVRPLGVAMRFVMGHEDVSDQFRFASSQDTGAGQRGFGSVTDDTLGGALSHCRRIFR